jgi:hypothetical protein
MGLPHYHLGSGFSEGATKGGGKWEQMALKNFSKHSQNLI